MKNLKYAIVSILNKPFFLVSTIFQLSIILLLLTTLIMAAISIFSSGQRVESAFEKRQYYAIQDKSDEKELFEKTFKSEGINQRMSSFLHFLRNNSQFTFLEIIPESYLLNPKDISYEYDYFLYDKSTPKIRVDHEFWLVFKTVSITSDFFKYFPVEVEVGNFDKDGILLGAQYQHHYKIGDPIEIYESSSKRKINKKVTGFLKKDAYFFSRGSGLINLDYYIIDHLENVKEDSQHFVSDVDHKVNQGVIITDDIQETFKQLNHKSKELSLYTTLEPLDLNKQSSMLLSTLQSFRESILPGAVCIFVFSLVNIIISLTNNLKKTVKEIAVHLLCGATIGDIIKRIFFMIGSYLLPAIIINQLITDTFINQLFLISTNDLIKIYLIQGLVFLLIGVLLAIAPVYYVLNLDISKLIKRENL